MKRMSPLLYPQRSLLNHVLHTIIITVPKMKYSINIPYRKSHPTLFSPFFVIISFFQKVEVGLYCPNKTPQTGNKVVKLQHMSENNRQQTLLRYSPVEAEGQCILLEISPVKLNLCKFVLFVIVCVIFVGIPLLLVHWYLLPPRRFPKLQRFFYFDYCSVQAATHVAVTNYDQELSICEIVDDTVFFNETEGVPCKVFTNRYMKYIIKGGQLVEAQLFDLKTRTRNIMSHQEKGLSNKQVLDMRRCYGVGTMVIHQPSALEILVKELLRPLYLFLFFSVALWLYEQYYYYAGIILFTSSVAIIVNLYQMVQLNTKIFHMAYYEVKVHALREGVVTEVSSLDLVPGDVVFLKNPIKIPFEGIILEGSALINECALTGESVPIVKKADVLQKYRSDKEKIDKTAYVYQGTTIIQVNSKKKMALFQSTRQQYGIPVCVTRTNFVTMKGQLIRIILFPKQQENIFQRESAKFLLFLFFVAIITYFGMIKYLSQVVAPLDIFIKFLDLIVITVPPALPVSMAFGVIYAIQKLKNKSIFCIEESKVITGGVVSFSCFDKTGTLTEDFMDFQCLIPAEGGRFYPTVTNRPDKKPNIEALLNREKYLYSIFNNMASNHSIIRLEDTGELIGDPMEVKLIQFGEFSLNQSNSDPEVIFSFESKRNQTGEVYRRFDFDSDVQRMSVVCKIGDKNDPQHYAYAKGSPEIMVTIMDKKSVPSNYAEVLKEYTSNGFRVLAIASKKVVGNIKTLTREEVQTGLQFNGFQVFENKLKPQTKGAIKQLREAQIGVVMITGDNPLTGSNIGFKCGIADKSKGMLICDYRDKRFVEEKFIYHEREEQEKPNETFESLNNNTKFDEEIELPFAEIKIFTNNDNFKTTDITCIHGQTGDVRKNQIAPLPNIPDENTSQAYMEKIITYANSINAQLCVTGNAFNRLFEGNVENLTPLQIKFLDCATIYARTKPNDKAKIVMVYQHTGKTVSMCGDGANDCGALKQADIGLSLSQAEASISAPFTSQVANISSMVELIKECRAGLATNFSLFNIMASYSLVQYTTSIICELFFAYPPDFNYLYWDIFCNFFFIVVIGYTATEDKLSIDKPNNSLFCFTNLAQVMIVFGIQVLGQISMILTLSGAFNQTLNYSSIGGMEFNKQRYILQEQFIKVTPETNILFLFTNFMYIFTLISFTIGRPWKKPFFTNKPFMLVLFISLAYSILIVIVPESRLALFKVQYLSNERVNGFVLGIALAFGIFIFFLEKAVMEPFSLWIRKRYPEVKWL